MLFIEIFLGFRIVIAGLKHKYQGQHRFIYAFIYILVPELSGNVQVFHFHDKNFL